ncbi:protein NRT1/ PTR FAMILY 3.1 isoform X1 [Selaginella moellendorffii]|nr:protein NRT1/ PTR FAMILY 3.1 isoform X1 [Selaginella moellendorffii]|eukprot:XP_002972328.2 protein NRT1/ PTR FAMILY 3.1 isoform X1 [Selaginella moellendorffii]
MGRVLFWQEHAVELHKSSMNLEAGAEGDQRAEDPEWSTTWRGRRIVKGGWKTSPFIFGNEATEKLGAIGLQVNLVTYLVQQLHFKPADASNTLTTFGGTAAFTPFVGAIIADAYVGRYWVVLLGSILFTLGSFVLTIQALVPSLRPDQCAAKSSLCERSTVGQLGFLYLSFVLQAAGSGGIRPCVAAFGADQFNEEDPKQRTQILHFFNWYYFTLQLATLITSTVFVWIQDNVGWAVGFGLPAVLMALSVISFVAGTPIYRTARPTGSPITRLFQVIAAAVKKRKLELPNDPMELFGAKDKLHSPTRLLHTDQFRFLDKAAIVTDDDQRRSGGDVDPWKVSSVHSVEELKLLLRLLPILCTGVLVFTAWAQQGTFWVQQGRTMDRRLVASSSFEIPPGSMTAFTTLALLVLIPVYDKLGIPVLRRITGHPRGLTSLQRIAIGLVVSILVMVAAAATEVKRRSAAAAAGLLDSTDRTIPISIFWLLPQYVLIGVMELFLSIGQIEFFYDQSPESMRSMATAVFWMVIGGGSYCSTAMVSAVHAMTNWVPDNINRGRLDLFYWMLAGILTVNLGVYLVVARWYRYKRWNDVPEENGKVLKKVEQT